MKKILSLLMLLVAIVTGANAAGYKPSADEVIILKDVYSSTATTAGYSSHPAIAWGGTASPNDKTAGDPNNGGAATSSSVACYSTKGNGGGKNITVSVTGVSKIIIYHENRSDRYIELRKASKSGTLIGSGSKNTLYTEIELDGTKDYSGDDVIFLHGYDGSKDQDFNVYAVKLIAASVAPVKDYTVTVATNNNSYGTVRTDDASLDEGETTTITATPKAGYEFTSWAVEGTGAELSSTTTNPTTLTMGTANATVTATFSAIVNSVTHGDATGGTYTISVDGGAATDANTTATIGQTITLSGTPAAASFTEVAWNVKDADDNEVTVTDGQFTMPATAVTIAPVFSKPYFVKVAIKNKNSADITGTASSDATADVNCQDNTKLGSKGHYVGFTLASETLKAGDIVEVKISQAGGGTFIFYDSKEQTNTILSTDVIPTAGTHRFVLPASAEGENSLYLVRGENENDGFNPFVTYIAIIRPDATITLNASGFATYSSATDFTFAGADAYGMKLSATALVGTKVTSAIKAGEGILFKGEPNAKVAIIETIGAEAIGENNNLIGTTDADNETISSSYTYKYALSGDTFLPYNGTLQPNKAFFGSDSPIANSLDMVFEDEATAINNVSANEVKAVAPVKIIKNGKLYIGNYNVAGQQVK